METHRFKNDTPTRRHLMVPESFAHPAKGHLGSMAGTRNAIILTIPALPDLDLSANRRRVRHFMDQAKDTKAERLSAGLLLAQARRGINPTYDAGPRYLITPVALHWTLYWPKGMRARDADGCADLLKPWIDAMKDLAWIPNDSPRYVRTVSYTSVPRSPLGPSMTLRIEGIYD